MFAATLLTVSLTQAQTPATFKPYKHTELRLPAVPIIVNDPYFSIWSPFDQLNLGPTRHWTGADKPLTGLLRVDGTAYRFMGSDNGLLLEPVLPMAENEAWTANYTMSEPEANWTNADYNEEGKAGWKNGKGAFGSENRSDTHTRWYAENSDIYIRRYFNVDAAALNDDYVLKFSHDDVCEIYLNGKKIVDTGMQWRWNVKQDLDTKMKKLLRAGRNVLSIATTRQAVRILISDCIAIWLPKVGIYGMHSRRASTYWLLPPIILSRAAPSNSISFLQLPCLWTTTTS